MSLTVYESDKTFPKDYIAQGHEVTYSTVILKQTDAFQGTPTMKHI